MRTCCILALLLTTIACSQTTNAPGAPGGDSGAPEFATGPYLGFPPPTTEPQIFASSVVSTGLSERDFTATPDGKELYFSAQVGHAGHFGAIVFTALRDGKWTNPEVAPFSGQYFDLEPAISPDGSKLFFMSNRPSPESDQPTESEDIWVVDRVGDGWGEPRNLGAPVNTENPEYFPSVTRDGTLYYTRREDDGTEAIFRARPAGDGYATPERLGPEVNSGKTRFNGFIAPDESYLILGVYGREDSLGGVDYYVVFRSEDDRWSEAINLGPKINQPTGNEWSASVSPDGKYLFFMSSRSVIENHRAPARMNYAQMRRMHDLAMNGNSDIWWVDASVVTKRRPEGF